MQHRPMAMHLEQWEGRRRAGDGEQAAPPQVLLLLLICVLLWSFAVSPSSPSALTQVQKCEFGTNPKQTSAFALLARCYLVSRDSKYSSAMS